MQMDIKKRLAILDVFYTIYEKLPVDWEIACRKQCATCCTSHVTMTTLEGLLILRHLESAHQLDGLEKIISTADSARFRPRLTINRLADLCAVGGEIPEEQINHGAGPCPALIDAACPIYAVRPFGCRAMVSQITCTENGAADMPEFVLTLNNVFLQYLEALDTPGLTGNFSDILRYLKAPGARRDYLNQRPAADIAGLLPNLPLKVLMVPPEHRRRIEPITAELHKAVQKALART